MLSRNTRLPCRGDCNKSTKVVADSRDPCAMVVYTKCNPTSGPQQSWPFYVFSNWHLACGSSWVWSILGSICGTLAATCHQSTQSGCKMVFFDRRLPNLVQEKQKANAHQCHHSISHELWRQNGNHGPISQRRTYNKFDAMACGNHWQIAMWHQKIVARMPGGDMLHEQFVWMLVQSGRFFEQRRVHLCICKRPSVSSSLFKDGESTIPGRLSLEFSFVP